MFSGGTGNFDRVLVALPAFVYLAVGESDRIQRLDQFGNPLKHTHMIAKQGTFLSFWGCRPVRGKGWVAPFTPFMG